MKKRKQEINLSDLYYKILMECVKDIPTTSSQISEKLGISEHNSAFTNLHNLEFIRFNHQSFVIELLPQGFSTYLSISSQKKSSEQARKATKFATWALVISSASFIANIIFNFL
jgi:hypothetical protein